MTVEAGTYESVQAFRATLLGLAERQARIIDELQVTTYQELMANLRRRVTSDTFKILVLGDFRQGKSTFINALLGEQVLPSFAWPTTAIVNEVKFADQRRAVLHMLPVKGKQPRPKEIPIADLHRYVTIDDDDPDKLSAYERAEVYWPLSLCRNGVEIVDSPGLNDTTGRTEVTVGYLTRADAVVLVLSAEKFLAHNERQFVEIYLKPLGQDNVVFVTNKINQIEPEARDEVIRRARQRAEPYLDRDERLFFVNAKGGLQARVANDADAWRESGLAAVEAYLERFLVESRGRAKIVGPARELRSAMNQIRKDLRSREGMLDLDREELQRRFADAQKPLRLLQRRRTEIVCTVENHNVETRAMALQAVRRTLEDIADRAPSWADEVETENELNLITLQARASRERFFTELGEKVSHRMRVALSEWMASDLQKLLADRVEDLEERIGRDLDDFAGKADRIRWDLNEAGGPDASREPSGGRRLAAAIAGLAPTDGVNPSAGSIYGFKDVATKAVSGLAVVFTGVALAMNPPVVLGVIGVVLGGALAERLIRKGGTEKKLRAAVAAKCRDELRGRAGKDAEAVAKRLDGRLGAMRDAVATTLANEVEEIRQQVNAALKEKTKGEARVIQARKELVAYAEEIDRINEELDDLIHRVIA
jgi:GTPase SAR1 family protein